MRGRLLGVTGELKREKRAISALVSPWITIKIHIISLGYLQYLSSSSARPIL